MKQRKRIPFKMSNSVSVKVTLPPCNSQSHRNDNGRIHTQQQQSFLIEKAFDKLCHKVLIFKMYKFGYSLELIKMIQSYLTTRKLRVKIDTTTSTWRLIHAGRHKAPSCPQCYSAYSPRTFQDPRGPFQHYADDLMISSTYRNMDFARNVIQDTTKAIFKFFYDYCTSRRFNNSFHYIH